MCMCFYTAMLCTDGTTINRVPCVLLAASSVVYYWMNVYYDVVCVFCIPCGFCTDTEVFVPIFM